MRTRAVFQSNKLERPFFGSPLSLIIPEPARSIRWHFQGSITRSLQPNPQTHWAHFLSPEVPRTAFSAFISPLPNDSPLIQLPSNFLTTFSASPKPGHCSLRLHSSLAAFQPSLRPPPNSKANEWHMSRFLRQHHIPRYQFIDQVSTVT